MVTHGVSWIQLNLFMSWLPSTSWWDIKNCVVDQSFSIFIEASKSTFHLYNLFLVHKLCIRINSSQSKFESKGRFLRLSYFQRNFWRLCLLWSSELPFYAPYLSTLVESIPENSRLKSFFFFLFFFYNNIVHKERKTK